MRLVIARRQGWRGEGLGNELFSWAKGWIASQILNARLIGPAWGINKRKYYRNFLSARWDFVFEEIGSMFSTHVFCEADYNLSDSLDFELAFRDWAERTGLIHCKHFIVIVDGMYGGYPAIRLAKNFLLERFLHSHWALTNLYASQKTLDPTKLVVAVHVRSGSDFRSADKLLSERGEYNVTVPTEWYYWICDCLQTEYKKNILFSFFSDKVTPEFIDLRNRFSCNQAQLSHSTVCSDLLLMMQADLRVCSVSSYSMAASAFSGGPYIWYKPQLHLKKGLYSLWHSSLSDTLMACDVAHSVNATKHTNYCAGETPCYLGSPMDVGDHLSFDLLRHLNQILVAKRHSNNLLFYGNVPA